MDEATVHISRPGGGSFALFCGAEYPTSRCYVTAPSAATMATCPACLDELAESLILRANRFREPAKIYRERPEGGFTVSEPKDSLDGTRENA